MNKNFHPRKIFLFTLWDTRLLLLTFLTYIYLFYYRFFYRTHNYTYNSLIDRFPPSTLQSSGISIYPPPRFFAPSWCKSRPPKVTQENLHTHTYTRHFAHKRSTISIDRQEKRNQACVNRCGWQTSGNNSRRRLSDIDLSFLHLLPLHPSSNVLSLPYCGKSPISSQTDRQTHRFIPRSPKVSTSLDITL